MKEKRCAYYIETYGCQMNAHDSEKLAGMLVELGYTAAPTIDEAGLVIFNTCCVRENAEKKTFGNVGALKKRKLRERDLIIAVCGCMMQQKEVAQRLVKTFPFVDIVFGTHNMADFPEMLASAQDRREHSLRIVEEEEDISEQLPMKRQAPPLCSVSIMQGCDNFCSYCIVPYVRGRERSRRSDEIVAEVAELADQGYREVMLLGQNVNSYGKGLAEQTSFAQLLRRVARETGIGRIRFMTSHPKDASDELLAVMRDEPKVCAQLHLPVQSGSTRVLRRMNRKYTREQYLELVCRARKTVPGIVLSTDIIVGFPGETDEDFEETLSLVGEVGFDAAFTFVYSPRKGTKAADFEDQIDETVKQERIVRLVALQNECTYQSNLSCEGSRQRVLVEDVSKRDEGCVCGRTDGGKMVNLPGGSELIGQFVEVEITEAKKTTLRGRILDGDQMA